MCRGSVRAPAQAVESWRTAAPRPGQRPGSAALRRPRAARRRALAAPCRSQENDQIENDAPSSLDSRRVARPQIAALDLQRCCSDMMILGQDALTLPPSH
ncbi:hypothetical protein GQ600_6658 [Phytophthora cactorum]|nr:hypothetical protein GQ600_6658 [Phytophthora cactorum]